MNRIPPLLLVMLFITTAYAQCPQFDQLIREGEAFQKNDRFREALEKYNTAKLCLPTRAAEVDKHINLLFSAIERKKDEAIREKKAAEAARVKAEATVQQMGDLISSVIDVLQSDNYEGIIGFAPLERDIIGQLLPHQQFVSKNTANVKRPWESARTHFRLGRSLETIGRSVESEKETEAAFVDAKKASEAIIRSKLGPLPVELHRVLVDAAVYHSWNLMNRNEIQKAGDVLTVARVFTEGHDVTQNSALVAAQAQLSNALSRLLTEQNDAHRSVLYQTKAVELARKSVRMDSTNLIYQDRLATFLRNLDTFPDSLVSPPAKKRYVAEAYTIVNKLIRTPGAGSIGLETLIRCIETMSYELTTNEQIDEATKLLNEGKERLTMFIQLDPTNNQYYLNRASLNKRLAYIKQYIKKDSTATEWLAAIASDWLKVVSGRPVLPQDVWLLKSTYTDIRDKVLDKYTKTEQIRWFKTICAAIDSSVVTYGRVPSIALIAGDSYAKLGETLLEKGGDDSTAIIYLTRSIQLTKNGHLLDDFSSFDEQYEWFCRPYEKRLDYYFKKADLKKVQADFDSIKKVFMPILERYPFDFYLRSHIINAHIKFGELLVKGGQYNQAKPVLEYASKWGDKASTEYLADLYKSKKVTVSDASAKADSLLKIAPGQSMKKITIPCDFNGVKIPFPIYVREWPKDVPFKGIDDQAEWLMQARGGVIPADVRESFRKLQQIAWENNVSFPDLCVYALGAAKDDDLKAPFEKLKKKIKTEPVADNKLTTYRELLGMYEEKLKKDSTRMVLYKDAATAYVEYGDLLAKSNQEDMAMAAYKQATRVDSANSDGWKGMGTVKYHRNKRNPQALLKDSKLLEKVVYLKLYLQEKNRKNADLITKDLLIENHSSADREAIYTIYANRDVDNFDELFLADQQSAMAFWTYLDDKPISQETNERKFNHYKKLIRLNEYLLKTDTTKIFKEKSSQQYNSYAWYSLLTQQYKEAADGLDKAMSLDGANLYPLSNLPHVLLFNGKIEEAKDQYMKLKNRKFDPKAGYPTFKDSFLSDFKDFEKVGITHPKMAEIIALLNDE